MADGSVLINAELNNSEFKKGIDKLESIGKKGLKGLGVAVGTATTGLTVMSTYALKVGSDFEAGMSKVQAISGATREEIDRLTEKAKEMGAKTKFSATESAEAFQYMAMAGWKTEDMLNGIEGIMNLASASGENLASVSDIVTDALTAFGLQANDSAHFADVLAKASSNSNTNVGLMGATFKYVAPIAGSMKYSIEDTAVAIGLMANAGIKGEQAGTALRAMLTRLVKPPKEASEALKQLNITTKNSDGTMKPLSQTLQELRTKFAGLTDSQKASYASSIAGTEAMSGMLAIVNASEDDFKKLTREINNSDGATKEMADTMQNNLKGATTILGSNMESLGIAIYDKFKKPATKGIKSVTKSVEDLTKQASNGKLSRSLDKIADGFGKLISKGGDLIAKILPKLIDGLAWVLDNGGSIAKVIGTMTAMVVAFKTGAVIDKVIKSWKNAQKALALFEATTKGVTIAQGLMNANLTIGQTAVALLTGKISLATVAQKLWNMAMSANPIGILLVAVTALTAGLAFLATRQTENQKKAKEFADEMANSRKEWEDYNRSIDETTNANLAQINSVEKLKDELKTLVDENGKVTKGYEGRVGFILNQLNEALGTEYKLNGDVIESYKNLQGEIDKLIQKKKAEIILQGQEEKYKETIKKQEQATKELKKAHEELGMSYKEAKKKYQDYTKSVKEAGQNADGQALLRLSHQKKEMDALENKIKAYEDAEWKVKDCVEAEKTYQENYAKFLEGKYDEIGNTVKDTTKNYTDTSLQTIKDSIEKEKNELERSKQLHETTNHAIYLQEREQAQKNLTELAKELKARTSTVDILGQDEIEAWKALATNSYEVYYDTISDMPEELRSKIEEMTGVTTEQTPYLVGATANMSKEILEQMKKKSEFKGTAIDNLRGMLSGLQNNELREVLRQSGVEDVEKVIEGIKQGNLGEEQGQEILSKLCDGLNNTGWHNTLYKSAKKIASNLSNLLNIKVTAQGANLAISAATGKLPGHKEGLDYVPYDNYIARLHKGERVLTKEENKTYMQGATAFSKGLDLSKLTNADRLFEKMKATVDYETSRLSKYLTSKATLQLEKDHIKTVNNDNGTTINNTQNFYSKESTPYEEQKQAKQQLRRLAYGL